MSSYLTCYVRTKAHKGAHADEKKAYEYILSKNKVNTGF